MSDMPPPPTPLDPGMGGGSSGSSNPDARMKAAIAHALPGLDWIGTGVLGTIGIIVMYFMLKDKEPAFVVDAMKQSLYMLVAQWILGVVLIVVAFATCGMGAILFLPAAIAVIVVRVIAAMKSYNGEEYRYPVIGNWTFLG